MNNLLEKYAEVAVNVGVNIQPGQELIINAPIEAVDLVRKVVDSAYKSGASNVVVFYEDDYTSLSRYKNVKEEYLTSQVNWLIDGITEGYRNNAARLVILGRNPTLLKDINPEIISKVARARGMATKELSNLITSSHSQWSIISYATEVWASQVFPNLPVEDAVKELWKGIFSSCRIDTPDPIQNWSDHNKKLHSWCDMMNEKRYHHLRYKSNKTDIIIGLADGHIWEAGSSKAKNGVEFNANIPTEEIYTTPHRMNVNGIIHATKPLLYRGNMIDGIIATFKDGKVIDVKTNDPKSTKILEDMLSEDEGASRIGEVALVPNSSPISKSGILYHETLFDENASCHLAFGQSYSTCMTQIDGETEEEYLARGANSSNIHVDWMVGDETLDIFGFDGTKEEQIFKNGEWAI